MSILFLSIISLVCLFISYYYQTLSDPVVLYSVSCCLFSLGTGFTLYVLMAEIRKVLKKRFKRGGGSSPR